MKVQAPQLRKMILRRKLMKVESQRRMLQLQRTRPQQSRTKDYKKLQHHLQRRMKNLPGMFIYLMVIAFYVLTMEIWLGIVKFLTGTIIIFKTLEESLQDNHDDFVRREYVLDGPKIKCFKCHNYGHSAHGCRYQMESPMDNIECFKCHNYGHMA